MMALSEAKEKLQLNVLPGKLPCREKEIAHIQDFLHDLIKNSRNGAMYIFGVPGTGKTASTRLAVKKTLASAAAGKLPSFDFVELNGMKLQRPTQVYPELLKGLKIGQKAAGEKKAMELLDKHFSSKSNSRSAVVLLDELDYLVDRSQSVIYNLFDWPTRETSKLIVIGITNSLELPYEIMQKIGSRLGLNRFAFAPYSRDQLVEIMRSRLRDTDVFTSEALEFCAKRIASVSGDVRRSLEICRRATELAAADGETSRVEIKHVEAAIQEAYQGTNLNMFTHLSTQEKTFLCLVARELTRSGGEAVSFGTVCAAHLAVAVGTEEADLVPMNASLISRLCARLISCGLLTGNGAREDMHQRIRLADITPDQVRYALSGDTVAERVFRAPAQ